MRTLFYFLWTATWRDDKFRLRWVYVFIELEMTKFIVKAYVIIFQKHFFVIGYLSTITGTMMQ